MTNLLFRPIDAIVQTIRQCDIEKFGVEDWKSLLKFVPDKTIVSIEGLPGGGAGYVFPCSLPKFNHAPLFPFIN